MWPLFSSGNLFSDQLLHYTRGGSEKIMFRETKLKFRATTLSLLRSLLQFQIVSSVGSGNARGRLTKEATGRLKGGINPQALERARTAYSVYANAHHTRVACS
jgi:hypothetical protein